MVIFIYDEAFKTHDTGFGHPEQSTRVERVSEALGSAGLKTRQNTFVPRPALESEILLCHSQSYFDSVKREVNALKGTQAVRGLSTGDVVISEHSFEVALLAAGGVLTAIDHVMKNPKESAFCIVRPPGHHASVDVGMGFCLYNNIAIGTRYAQERYGIKRVLIADWDVHHGNGTQDIFYQDPSVFYFSTHEQGLYPLTGSLNEEGEGPGKGFTLNCPIMPTLKAREEVLSAFSNQLVKKMKSFKPDLVMMSSGFDGHYLDPLGHFNLTDEDFFELTRMVKSMADEHAKGRVVSVLEGGYNLSALATSSIAHVRALESVRG